MLFFGGWPGIGIVKVVRRASKILVILFFLGASAFFLWGFYRTFDFPSLDQRMPFQLGHGIGLLTIGMVVALLWGSWRSTPPSGGDAS